MKKKEIYDKLVAERKNVINTSNEKVKYNNLTYHFFQKRESKPVSFIDFNCQLGLLRKIRDDDIELKIGRKNQKEFKSNLNEIVRRQWNKSEEQKSII